MAARARKIRKVKHDGSKAIQEWKSEQESTGSPELEVYDYTPGKRELKFIFRAPKLGGSHK